MFPGCGLWWRARRACGHFGHSHAWPGCHSEDSGEGEESFGGGGGFGVRRPLRFLAHKLDLDDSQVSSLARILDELKTERAQAEVDRRRTVAAFADAIGGDTFDTAKANEGGELRVKSAERLRQAVLTALQQIHALLNADQRKRLAYLIRSGALAI
jgi:Spy/CpxP family protein refolding chaperone